ncbi:MAG TPA: hypothetical protein DDZ92_04005 [Halomonas sp.]|nr:hypothetical protein [Halomonas sp.]|tara:strand:+ start:2310 stop:2630 length:321 start_codon:yes stop_codon:yes gene_type:complete
MSKFLGAAAFILFVIGALSFAVGKATDSHLAITIGVIGVAPLLLVLGIGAALAPGALLSELVPSKYATAVMVVTTLFLVAMVWATLGDSVGPHDGDCPPYRGASIC